MDLPSIPATISVRFRVLKEGSGSGTVRSGAGGVDCGNSCVSEQNFGTQQNLVADPDGGSNFSGWRGACSTAPACSLAVGPVTTLAAVFNAAPSTSSSGSQPSSSSPPSRPAPRFVARLRRFVVSGHGRKRRILIRVQVNARTTVRATLDQPPRAPRDVRSAGGSQVGARCCAPEGADPDAARHVPARPVAQRRPRPCGPGHEACADPALSKSLRCGAHSSSAVIMRRAAVRHQ